MFSCYYSAASAHVTQVTWQLYKTVVYVFLLGLLLFVTLRRGMGCVTVSGQLPMRKIYLSLTNHPGQLSLAIPRG